MSARFVGSTVTRLHLADPYAPEDFSGTVRTGVEGYVFTDYLTPTQKGVRTGFVRADEPLVLPVDVSDTGRWIHLPYVALAWRVDAKKVPPKRLKAEVEIRARAWCVANQRERCPRLVRSEIQETVELELLPRCMPTTKVVSIVWNTQEGWILLSTQGAAMVDAIRKLLHRAFGVVATPDSPDDGLDEGTLARLAETKPLVLAITPEGDGSEVSA